MADELLTEKGFIIAASGNEANGNRPRKWTLEGAFAFSDRAHFDEFVKDLAAFFEYHVTNEEIAISTIEAFELWRKTERDQGTLPLGDSEAETQDHQDRVALQKASGRLDLDQRSQPSHQA